MLINEETCREYSDKALVKMALANIDYFLCLYERYEPRLLRYISHITQVSHEHAQDILQESFIKIWQNLHGFDQKLKLSSWIYRIVHNETISYWRTKTSYGKDRKVPYEDSMVRQIPEDLSELMSSEYEEAMLYEVLDLLPLTYKTVLVLKYIEGMGYQEISDVLKIPEGTVATRINRAKKRFIALASEKHMHFYNSL